MGQNDLNDLHEKIGYIKAQVEKIDGMDNRLHSVEKKMNNILGYAAGVSALFSLVIVFVKDKFKNLI